MLTIGKDSKIKIFNVNCTDIQVGWYDKVNLYFTKWECNYINPFRYSNNFKLWINSILK